MNVPEVDSLLRAVAPAPAVAPPTVKVSAIVVNPREAEALARVRELAAPFELDVTSRDDGRLLATVPVARANAAASCALALHRALPRARVAIVTGSIGAGPSALDQLVERAAALAREDRLAIDAATADLLDARFEVRSEAGAALLVGARASAVPREREQLSPDADRDARIARAVEDERLLNMRRLLQLVAPIVALNLIRQLVAGHEGPTLPFNVAWLVVAVTRVIVLSARRATPRWILYSPFFADLPLCFFALYRAVLAAPAHPGQTATFWLCDAIVILAVAQFVMSPRRVAALAVMLAAMGSVLYALADQPGYAAVVVLIVSVMVAIAVLSQARTKALLHRIAVESEARTREVEAVNVELRRQVAERSRDLSEALARLAAASHVPQYAPGDVLEDRYRIIRRIGAGGMGEVHEVERLTDGRRFALKIMTGTVHREALARFAREAQLAAELDAPNLVAAVDVGITRAGTLFLVMELVAGMSLAAAHDRYGDVAWAVPILAQVARALAVMHGRGIVHRDLKPSNVLLDGATAKVSDFGIAGLFGDDPFAGTIAASDAVASPSLTRTGALIGTPLYMAPELVRGAREASPASDVFSFGVVAYELLAGQLPHATPPVLERLAGRIASPTPLAQVAAAVPVELCALVDRCLSESADARPAAHAIASALGEMARAR